MKEKSSIRIELERIIPKMCLINVVVYPISLFFGFDLSFLIGLVVGTLFACLQFVYLGYTINKSVEMAVKRAQRQMLFCYSIRFLVLAALCFFGHETGTMSFPALVIPQFYARIVVSLEIMLPKVFNKKK